MATPVLAELKAAVADLDARLHRAGGRAVEDRRGRVEAAGRAMRRVEDLVELAAQRFGLVSNRLGAGLARNATAHQHDLAKIASRLTPLLLARPQAVQRERLGGFVQRMSPAMRRGLDRAAERLEALSKLHISVDPDRPLQRGFARVARADGALVHAGASLASGEEVAITFGDKVTRQAVIDGAAGAPAAPRSPRAKPKSASTPQGDLF
jgi:exodeoxyribonuclease VII large subunit